MSGIAWETAHSADTNANPAFAWAYMTNVGNWDDPAARAGTPSLAHTRPQSHEVVHN